MSYSRKITEQLQTCHATTATCPQASKQKVHELTECWASLGTIEAITFEILKICSKTLFHIHKCTALGYFRQMQRNTSKSKS